MGELLGVGKLSLRVESLWIFFGKIKFYRIGAPTLARLIGFGGEALVQSRGEPRKHVARTSPPSLSVFMIFLWPVLVGTL